MILRDNLPLHHGAMLCNGEVFANKCDGIINGPGLLDYSGENQF
jgi:hypothetical protein